jgi:hypothetical protein
MVVNLSGWQLRRASRSDGPRNGAGACGAGHAIELNRRDEIRDETKEKFRDRVDARLDADTRLHCVTEVQHAASTWGAVSGDIRLVLTDI